MFTYPVWEVLFYLLWHFAGVALILFLFWGFGELWSRIFE